MCPPNVLYPAKFAGPFPKMLTKWCSQFITSPPPHTHIVQICNSFVWPGLVGCSMGSAQSSCTPDPSPFPPFVLRPSPTPENCTIFQVAQQWLPVWKYDDDRRTYKKSRNVLPVALIFPSFSVLTGLDSSLCQQQKFLLLLLLICVSKYVIEWFLDAMPSPSTYPCQWVSQSVQWVSEG